MKRFDGVLSRRTPSIYHFRGVFMTTIFQHNIRCSVCGNERMTTGVGSYSTMGMLISGKPLFMGMNPLDRMIDICPKCGYCSPDLSSSLGLDPSVLESDGYKDAKELGGGLGAYAYILSQRGSIAYQRRCISVRLGSATGCSSTKRVCSRTFSRTNPVSSGSPD